MTQLSTDVTLELIRDELARLAPDEAPAELRAEDEIAALDIESLALLELIAVLEERLAIQIPDDELTALVTVGDLVALVHRHGGVATS